MSEIPSFFVPNTTSETEEAVLADLAAFAGQSTPEARRRVYSITYTHDREEWTATVGRTLRGINQRTSRLRGRVVQRKHRVSDSAIVLAIFPGSPYVVVTNARPIGNVPSAWNNPFYVGRPQSVSYFNE